MSSAALSWLVVMSGLIVMLILFGVGYIITQFNREISSEIQRRLIHKAAIKRGEITQGELTEEHQSAAEVTGRWTER